MPTLNLLGVKAGRRGRSSNFLLKDLLRIKQFVYRYWLSVSAEGN